MDKLSEYIPIVIILVSVIFSIVGKKKKGGKVTQKTILPGKTVEMPVEEKKLQSTLTGSIQRTVERTPKKQVSWKSEIKPEKEIVPSFSPALTILESEEDNSFFSFEGEEDVTKAIIYAEIINRKEW